MKKNILKLAFFFSAPLLMSGCGLFSSDKSPLEGERLSIIEGNAHLKPDYDVSKLIIKLPAPYINADWSQSGGNATHNMGHLYASNKIKERWSKSFGEGNSKRDVLIASPIVAYKVVFAIDADAIVTARRLDNGKQIWKRRLKPLNKDEYNVSMKGAGIAEYDNKIFATTGFGGIFALDMKKGKILWRLDINTPIRIAPSVNNNILFAQTIENELIAIDTQSGQKIWDYKTSVEATTLVGGASPAYDKEKDVVVAAFSTGEIRAFKASTGTPLWSDFLVSKKRTNSLSNITTIKSNPIIDNDVVYAASNSNILAAFDLRTGSRIWEKEIATHNQPWVAGKFIFVLSSDFELLSIEKSSGKIVWNTLIPLEKDEEKGKVIANGPILVGDRLILTTSNGYLFAVSPYTGDIISYISMGDEIQISPVVAEEVVLFTTSDAELIAYK